MGISSWYPIRQQRSASDPAFHLNVRFKHPCLLLLALVAIGVVIHGRLQCSSRSEDCSDKSSEDMSSIDYRPETVGDRILTLTEDETRGKKVYAIGDVHGCYDELTSLLRKCNVLKTEDPRDGLRDDVIVVFVGDLVNKGPHSEAVLRFARDTERVYSVRGNHEVYWLESSTRSLAAKYRPYLASLPYLIRIPEYNALVVHAGLIPGRSLEEQYAEEIVHMRNIVARHLTEASPPVVSSLRAAADREAAEVTLASLGAIHHLQGYTETDRGVHWARLWAGPEHVYFGHDARRGRDEQGRPRVQRFPLATGLDTRCVKGGSLTAVVLPSSDEQFYSVPSQKAYSLM